MVLQHRTDEDNGMMFKIVIGVTLSFIVLGACFMWLSRGDQEKQAKLYYAQAQDECNKNDLSTCLSTIDKALAITEKTEYYQLKFSALMSYDRLQEAKLVLEKLIDLDPKNPQYYYLMRTFAQNEGDYQLAIKDVDKALALSPENGNYLVTKASLLIDLERQGEAVPIYQKLIEKDPNNYTYWNEYAVSYSNSKKYDEALKIRLDGLKKFPNSPLHHFGLANLYDQMGKKEEAAAEYRKSLELHPMENSIAAKRIYEITGKRVPPALENQTTDSIPYVTSGKVMFITADINGRKGTFLLDTGASMSGVYQSVVSKYQLKPMDDVMTFQTANGIVQSPITYGNLRLGRHDLDNTEFAVLPDNQDIRVDGIIGMNVLEQFQYEINQPGSKLVLRR